MMNKNRSLLLKTDIQVSLRKTGDLLTITDKIRQNSPNKILQSHGVKPLSEK